MSLLELIFERTDEGPRLRALWRLLAQTMLFFVGVNVIFSLLTVVWSFVKSRGETLAPNAAGVASGSPEIFLVQSLASLGAVLLSVWVAGRSLDRRPFEDFGFHPSGGWWLDFLFGLVLGALLMSGIFLVELGLGWVSVTGTLRSLSSGEPFPIALLVPAVSFLCVGIYEELMFRGYRLRNLAEGLNFPSVGPRSAVLLAWVGSSVYFGLGHAGNPDATTVSTANIVVAGLMLGLGYVLTGELAIPIGLHITWNLFEGNVFGFPVSGISPVGATFVATEGDGPALWTGGGFGPEAGLLGVAVMIAGCLLILLWVRVRRGEVSVHTPVAEPPKPHVPGGSARNRAPG